MGRAWRCTGRRAAAVDQLTIAHVGNGCHVWSNRTAQTPVMRLTLQRGQKLSILNQDVDMYRMMQLACPQMMLGAAMRQGQMQALTFTNPGTYRFMTWDSAMAGMPAVATTGRTTRSDWR
jgi:S-formylglutathione hydrolase FrmB